VFGGYSRPLLVGAMAPWIGMLGSTSTPAGSPPISSAKSQDWSPHPRNGLLSLISLRTPRFSAAQHPNSCLLCCAPVCKRTAQQQTRWTELPCVKRVERGFSGTRMNYRPRNGPLGRFCLFGKVWIRTHPIYVQYYDGTLEAKGSSKNQELLESVA
jgi:hypothetical protein